MTLTRATVARGLALLAALFVAAQAALFSAAYANQHRNPDIALKLDASNPEARVKQAERWLASGDVPGGSGDAVLEAARRSIASTPLNAPAFRLFATTGASSEEFAEFEARVAMSDRLSRRDLGTQLFLIEAAVQRSDIVGALEHYDTSLRIRESSRALLFPVLSGAVREAAIRDGLQRYLDPANPWIGGFLRYAVANSSDPVAVTSLLMSYNAMTDDQFHRSIRSEMLSRLVNENEFGAAIRYFRSLGGADPDIATSLAFTDGSIDAAFAPVAWEPFSLDRIDSMFLASPDGGIELATTASPGFAGGVARRVTAFAPGNYRFSSELVAENAPSSAFASWRIECANAGERNTIFSLERGIEGTTEFSGEFTIPAGCTEQLVTLLARTGAEPRSLRFAVRSPRIERR